MKKLVIILTLLFALAGCGEFFTGKEKTTTDPKTGKAVITYEDAPIDSWTAIIATLIPVGGAALVGAGHLARNAARAKNGIMDANADAIENADWKQVNSAESFKELLKLYQDSHDDSKLLAKEYKKWKKTKV